MGIPNRKRKLRLHCGYSLGDIVMMTAAVRDLHRDYPGRFLTDVHTSCMEVWEHNPYLTPLDENDPEIEVIDCSYPLINRSNDAPYHCLHGFIEFLNEKLGLQIRPSEFHGDIHLSDEERAWFSQVHELTGTDLPFWILAAGGKYDIPIKWWDARRYQQVVDYFRGKIQFVQVGGFGHFHPALDGVIDLRGMTTIRELIRLVYHAQGVLCSVTALMHLAAAVEVKEPKLVHRPAVVVAGGREPAHWEAYPHHQFIHNNGALPCCRHGGCWKDRVIPLGDGDERDQEGRLCQDVVSGLPRCMDMITAAEVIRRIELYYEGGVLSFLSPSEVKAAKRGISKTRNNAYDHQPLTIHNARLALDRFIETIPSYPENFNGRGIVICGGGAEYFVNAWVTIQMLQRLGCKLPIQLWHLGPDELDSEMRQLATGLGVECVDALEVRQKHPARILNGWELKAFSILHCPFKEVLYLDADNVPVADPERLFASPQFKRTGAVFWPDYGRMEKSDPIWTSCGLARPDGPEFESGQIVVDKERCWKALSLAMWFNENSDLYYSYIHGDKETFHLAFRKLNQPFSFVPFPIHTLDGTMCQHDFDGRRIFQHRNTDKWNLFLRNKTVKDFWFEKECKQYVWELRSKWRGQSEALRTSTRASVPARRKRSRIVACMMSCPERNELRTKTIEALAATDWGEEPLVQMDPGELEGKQERQTQTAWLALKKALAQKPDYILFLEDDLDFNLHLRHNLEQWKPFSREQITLAGLYNPRLRYSGCDWADNYFIVRPTAVFGSQSFLISARAARFVVRHWTEIDGMQDIRISRLAGRLGEPIYYHSPSLVQHVGQLSAWGGPFHQAFDFEPNWKASR